MKISIKQNPNQHTFIEMLCYNSVPGAIWEAEEV